MRNWHQNTNRPNVVGSGPDVSVALVFMTHPLKKRKKKKLHMSFLAKSRWLSFLSFTPPLDFTPPTLSSVISVNHSKAKKYFFFAKNKTSSPKASKSENLPFLFIIGLESLQRLSAPM